MKSFELLKAETLPLTRELVERHRGLKASPTERALKPKRVAELSERLKNDLCVTFGWVTAEYDGTIYRMNGQHSGYVLSQMNGEFPADMYVHLDHYKVDSKEGLAELFRQFDARMSARSPEDVSGAYQGLEADLEGVPVDVGKLAIDGIAWHEHYVVGVPSQSGDDKYRLFHHEVYHDFIKWCDGILTKKNHELRTPAIVAAIFASYRADPEAAAEFWQDVAKGGDAAGEDVAFVLSSWLLNVARKPRSGFRPANLYQGCVFAWNVNREGKSTAKIKSEVTNKGFFELVD
jgi:hypothetical protein